MNIKNFGNRSSPARRRRRFWSTALEGHRTGPVTGETSVPLTSPAAEGCATTPEFLDFGTSSRMAEGEADHVSACQYTF